MPDRPHSEPVPNDPELSTTLPRRVPGERYPDDPQWRYRCTFMYADGVTLPKVAGEVAVQTVHANESGRDMEVSAGQSREDIGRILVEVRHFDDVAHANRGDRWTVERAWTRTEDGWEHS